MKKQLILILLALAFLAGCSQPSNNNAKWGYGPKDGPAHWGKNHPVCSKGKEQSPININTRSKDLIKTADKNALQIHYGSESQFILNNNGHSVEANVVKTDLDYILVKGTRYNLLQFHFHTPAENTFNGHHYAAEFHFVNQNKDGNLAVVAVFLKVGEHANPAIAEWLKNIPEKYTKAAHQRQIDLYQMLPKNLHTYYHFMGSLTVPPCGENVSWFVLTTPVEISKEQLLQIRKVYKDNHRPVQPLNHRRIVYNQFTEL